MEADLILFMFEKKDYATKKAELMLLLQKHKVLKITAELFKKF